MEVEEVDRLLYAAAANGRLSEVAFRKGEKKSSADPRFFFPLDASFLFRVCIPSFFIVIGLDIYTEKLDIKTIVLNFVNGVIIKLFYLRKFIMYF